MFHCSLSLQVFLALFLVFADLTGEVLEAEALLGDICGLHLSGKS
jgi:hypothetical protein